MVDILLHSNQLEVKVSSVIGASLSKFSFRRPDGQSIDLMRPPGDKARDALDMSMYPMVPYAGRIRGGSFVYWGVRHIVPQNHPFLTEPLNGDGWTEKWRVTERSENFITLTYQHTGETGFPFPYSASIVYGVSGHKFTAVISVTNTGDFPMPCGLGWHPFFLRTKDMRIRMRNRQLWADENKAIKTQIQNTPEHMLFTDDRALDDMDADACFGGFDGKIEITYPSHRIRLNVAAKGDCSHVTLYTPADKKWVCIEPMTNATDAFNLASAGVSGTGIKTIQDGESFKLETSFSVTSF
ncbi:MAG: hypothetical protein FWF01_02150 [Alphaproteobacteria bacterium]|nr:hypothetical protein [Alphaproteobacteria bacterium]